MTEGRRALLQVLQLTTAREVAARCRVSPMAVSFWARGRSRPRPAVRTTLEATYGIRADAWIREARRVAA